MGKENCKIFQVLNIDVAKIDPKHTRTKIVQLRQELLRNGFMNKSQLGVVTIPCKRILIHGEPKLKQCRRVK